MTLTLTQTCDGCHVARELEGQMTEEHAGWRVVSDAKPKKHLCADCIRKALKGTAPSDSGHES